MEKEEIPLEKKNIEEYSAALNLLFYEGQIAWQMNLLFIGLNVGIGAVIGGFINEIVENRISLSIFSIFGLIINVAWLGTFRRNNKYYHFRMAQARNAEPKEWKLLRKRGYKFSKGFKIIIDEKGLDSNDKSHKLTWFEKRASNKYAIGVSIWLFIIGFISLLAICIYSYFTCICSVSSHK